MHGLLGDEHAAESFPKRDVTRPPHAEAYMVLRLFWHFSSGCSRKRARERTGEDFGRSVSTVSPRLAQLKDS